MDDEDLIREQLREVPYELLASELARRNAAKRSPNQMTGRPVKLSKCPWCQEPHGVEAMRKHKPACPKNPRNEQKV